MKTHDYVKLQYFDAVVEQLRKLAVSIDEDCPHDYRTTELANVVNSSFDLLNEVAHEHLLKTDGDDIPPITL